ncbi:MAG: xanthine dehydrogenase family protein subunit M [Deltaproteobacteria bacterium]|nr:xanthine dehydrogenase family protein subunit M [Deltaproteobacteria bacterium]
MTVHFPEDIKSALDLFDMFPDSLLWAGGTDLMAELRAKKRPAPESVIFLEKVKELAEIRDEGVSIFIGAGARLSGIAENKLILDSAPVLTQALCAHSSPPIRNMATLGGNICTASPAADAVPPLYVLGGELLLQKKDASRKVRAGDFFLGPRKTVLEKGELLTGVSFPKPPQGSVQYFEKVGQRKALAIAIVSMAAILTTDSGGRVEKARFAWGSVGPTVVRIPETEAIFEGKKPTHELFRQAAELVKDSVRPIDDIRASAAYRSQVAGNLVLRLLPDQV